MLPVRSCWPQLARAAKARQPVKAQPTSADGIARRDAAAVAERKQEAAKRLDASRATPPLTEAQLAEAQAEAAAKAADLAAAQAAAILVDASQDASGQDNRG